MEPSQLVAALLERGGMTQTQIAEACGCSQSTISDIAKGKNKSPAYHIGKKLEALVAALPVDSSATASLAS